MKSILLWHVGLQIFSIRGTEHFRMNREILRHSFPKPVLNNVLRIILLVRAFFYETDLNPSAWMILGRTQPSSFIACSGARDSSDASLTEGTRSRGVQTTGPQSCGRSVICVGWLQHGCGGRGQVQHPAGGCRE